MLLFPNKVAGVDFLKSPIPTDRLSRGIATG